MNLSPLPIQKFFDNNGNPLAGGLLFTYAAGGSVKVATYKDSTGGTPNTNPIVLDFRGECRLWINPTLAYKFILAPATDTDPPTSPIWTVDNITAGPAQQDNSAVDTGSVNAIQLSIPQITAPVAFTRIVFQAGHTNTGPVTISINGGTTKRLLWQNFGELGGGEIQTSGIYQAIYDGATWQLQGPTLDPTQLRTATETTAVSFPTDYAYLPVPEDVRRYGAEDTAADSTTAIQATINSLNAGTVKGGGVSIPGDANSVYNISAALTFQARTAGDNHTDWYSFRGIGRGAPRIKAITGMANQPMVNMSGQDIATLSYYREVKDMYLQGAGIAQRGIELHFNQHFKVENVFINGLANGSGTASGVRVNGAICSSFRDIKVHNIEGNGIYAPGGSGNFFNANLIEGCSFLDLTGDGLSITGGISGCAVVGNTFEFCDSYGIRLAGFSGTGGLFGGNYLESNGLGDILIGESTAANNVVFEGNYLNGYDVSVSTSTYTPIRMKFADGVIIVGNMVALNTKSPTGFIILDANIAGGAVTNCLVAYNQSRTLALATAPNTMYNLPGSWVNNNNTLIDPSFVPLIQANATKGRWPYGGWTASLSGTGLAQHSSLEIFGADSLLMSRPVASTASVSKVVTLTAQMKNRFVTFAVPILAQDTLKQMSITATPNGTSPQATTITETLALNASKIVYVLTFVPADATTITLTISMDVTDATYTIGQPCLYVGAQPWYSSEGDQDAMNSAMPTTGFWQQGKFVRNTTPALAAGKVTTGWTRLTTGSGNVLNTDWAPSVVPNT